MVWGKQRGCMRTLTLLLLACLHPVQVRGRTSRALLKFSGHNLFNCTPHARHFNECDFCCRQKCGYRPSKGYLKRLERRVTQAEVHTFHQQKRLKTNMELQGILEDMTDKITWLETERVVLEIPLPKAECTDGVVRCAEIEGQRIVDKHRHREATMRARAEFDNLTKTYLMSNSDAHDEQREVVIPEEEGVRPMKLLYMWPYVTHERQVVAGYLAKQRLEAGKAMHNHSSGDVVDVSADIAPAFITLEKKVYQNPAYMPQEHQMHSPQCQACMIATLDSVQILLDFLPLCVRSIGWECPSHACPETLRGSVDFARKGGPPELDACLRKRVTNLISEHEFNMAFAGWFCDKATFCQNSQLPSYCFDSKHERELHGDLKTPVDDGDNLEDSVEQEDVHLYN